MRVRVDAARPAPRKLAPAIDALRRDRFHSPRDVRWFSANGDELAEVLPQLGCRRLGPLEFGSDGAEVVSILAESLGGLDEDSGAMDGTGELGTCPGDWRNH